MKLPKALNPLPDISYEKAHRRRSKLLTPKSKPDFLLLQDLYELGYKKIVGLDEVGRGALAGPIVVAAIELPVEIIGINDSKLVSRQQREILSAEINNSAHQQMFGSVTNSEIDLLGVAAALLLAYERALEKIDADLLLTDFTSLPGRTHFRAIKGDSLFYPVAAASIAAKVYRDNLMRQMHREFAEYDWENNVGYGTKKHLGAIKKFGPSQHHRISFLK